MIIENNKLIANDKMILTNGEVYGKEVLLGCNDSADNWREITEGEYQEKLKEESKEE